MSGKPILVVDDNVDDVEAVKRVAAKCRLVNPFVSVESAEQAICYLKGEGPFADREVYPLPVLILLDLVMPGAGGLAVLEWMQKQPERIAPIVILTGFRDLRKVVFANEMGAHSFLMKPFEEKELRELVKQFRGIYFACDSETATGRASPRQRWN